LKDFFIRKFVVVREKFLEVEVEGACSWVCGTYVNLLTLMLVVELSISLTAVTTLPSSRGPFDDKLICKVGVLPNLVACAYVKCLVDASLKVDLW